MGALRDVEEDAIYEKQKRFNIQVLAPRETQVKEELSETLVVYAKLVQLFLLVLSSLLPESPPLFNFLSLLVCQEFSLMII